MPFKKNVTDSQSWADIPTCKEAGVNVSYQMLRGIFMPGGVTAEQVEFYVQLFNKVRALPEWQTFIETGAFDDVFQSGDQYVAWLNKADETHRMLMQQAGFLAK
jgi:putative tricarboxylic transport membrane protein